MSRLAVMLLLIAGFVDAACGGVGTTAQKGNGTGSSQVVGDGQQSRQPSRTDHQNVKVEDNGFTQLPPDSIGNSYISYAAVLKNPNADRWIAEQVSVNVTFYNAANTVVKSTDDTVSIMLPGQTLAVANSAQVQSATRMEVQALVGRWEQATSPLGAFTVEGVTSNADDFSLKTNGTVSSTFAKDLKNVEASAVYFDADNKIIGGAFTFIKFVPAGGKTGFEITSLQKLPNVARTGVYVGITSLSLLS